MSEKYIHLNYILRFIREVEKLECKIVSSLDFSAEVDNLSFKAIIPKSFDIKTMRVVESEDYGYNFEIIDNNGNNAINGPCIVLWDSELRSYSPKVGKIEKNVYISSEAIENGGLFFENFKNIPEIVSFKEIENYM